MPSALIISPLQPEQGMAQQSQSLHVAQDNLCDMGPATAACLAALTSPSEIRRYLFIRNLASPRSR